MNRDHGCLHLRIAASFAQRACGLLWCAPLRDGDALLIPGCHAVHTCGMRYAIDVVFLDASGCVLAVVAGLAPWRCAARCRAAAVLELAAGSAARFGLVPGARLGAIADINQV